MSSGFPEHSTDDDFTSAVDGASSGGNNRGIDRERERSLCLSSLSAMASTHPLLSPPGPGRPPLPAAAVSQLHDLMSAAKGGSNE